MPVFPSQDLYNKKICESYPQLLQIYNTDVVLDGTGSQKQFLNITASYALNCNCASGSIYNSVTASFISSSTWVFNHNLQSRPVVVQAYDYFFNKIIPSNIRLINDNTAVLTFPISESGYVVATRGGLRTISSSLLITGSTYPITSSWTISASYAPCTCPIMHTGSTYPITASWAINTQTSSYIQVTGVSYPVKRIYNNYTVVRTTDYTILCDATSGSFDVKLPNPVGNTNIYNIKKIDTTGHRINVMVANASYIDYDFTQSISHRGTNMSLQSDGTNQYWIL